MYLEGLLFVPFIGALKRDFLCLVVYLGGPYEGLLLVTLVGVRPLEKDTLSGALKRALVGIVVSIGCHYEGLLFATLVDLEP